MIMNVRDSFNYNLDIVYFFFVWYCGDLDLVFFMIVVGY